MLATFWSTAIRIWLIKFEAFFWVVVVNNLLIHFHIHTIKIINATPATCAPKHLVIIGAGTLIQRKTTARIFNIISKTFTLLVVTEDAITENIVSFFGSACVSDGAPSWRYVARLSPSQNVVIFACCRALNRATIVVKITVLKALTRVMAID